MEWIRIPEPIEKETDRRELAAILAECGMSVRIVKARAGTSKSAPWRKFVEYRK